MRRQVLLFNFIFLKIGPRRNSSLRHYSRSTSTFEPSFSQFDALWFGRGGQLLRPGRWVGFDAEKTGFVQGPDRCVAEDPHRLLYDRCHLKSLAYHGQVCASSKATTWQGIQEGVDNSYFMVTCRKIHIEYTVLSINETFFSVVVGWWPCFAKALKKINKFAKKMTTIPVPLLSKMHINDFSIKQCWIANFLIIGSVGSAWMALKSQRAAAFCRCDIIGV